MRWGFVVGGLLVLATGAGCPHDWAKRGTHDRAMAKDTRTFLDEAEQEESIPDCPEGQSWKEVCKPGEGGALICKGECL